MRRRTKTSQQKLQLRWESKFLKQNDYKTPEDPGKWAFSGVFCVQNEISRGWCDGLLSSLKANTKYTYRLYLKLTDNAAAEGYVFGPNTRLKVNGKYVGYTHSDETSVSLQIGTELTMMPTVEGTSDYKIIEGANGSWTQNSDGTLTFRADGDFGKFTGVKVDDTLIDAKNYTAVSGSTVITLNTNHLKTLSVGTHELTVVYTDGECSTNFEIKQAASDQTKPTEGNKTDTETPTGDKDTASPQTDDATNLALWIALMLLSGAGITGVTLYTVISTVILSCRS